MRKDLSFLLLAAIVVFAPASANAQSPATHEGMIEPYLTVNVSAQVSGILAEVSVKRGDILTKGQVLATLRSGVEKADLEQAAALLDFNRRKLSRNKDLFDKGNVSANDEDEMETEIKKDQAILDEVTAKLEMKIIRSPVDGVVVKVDLSAGEYVGDKPIMTIAQIDPLNVEVVVPVAEYGTIKKGMRAEVRPEYPVGGVYTGKVTIVDRVINAASGSFGVRVELPNSNLAIPSGLKCNVNFKGMDAPKQRTAPSPRPQPPVSHAQ
jgi:RND family efflux transporter MFP subunit